MFRWRKSGAGSGCDPPRSIPPCRGARPGASRSRRPGTDRCGPVRFAATGHGDVKSLKDRPGELCLRVGKWRVFFCLEPPDSIRVLGIDDRVKLTDPQPRRMTSSDRPRKVRRKRGRLQPPRTPSLRDTPITAVVKPVPSHIYEMPSLRASGDGPVRGGVASRSLRILKCAQRNC